MNTPDRQLVAFAGKSDGSIFFVDRRCSPELHELIREPNNFDPVEYQVAGEIDADPLKWEDALKVSGCVNLTILAEIVRGGREDVLDVNHSRNCRIIINHAFPRGNFVSTQKGGSKNIEVVINHQHGHGKETDHDYGNFSDQGNGRTSGCSLSSITADKSEVKVRLLTADSVRYGNENVQRYKTQKLNQGWFYPLYNFIKDLLRQLKIKV